MYRIFQAKIFYALFLFLCSRKTRNPEEATSSVHTADTEENSEEDDLPVPSVAPPEKKLKISSQSSLVIPLVLPEVPCSSKDSSQETDARKKPSGSTTVVKRKQSQLPFSSNTALTPARSELLTQQIARMISLDLQPLSIVEDQGFRELIELLVPLYEMPSRRTIRRRIELLHSKMENELKAKIKKEAEVLALTTDGWTSCHNESYLAFTAHFIDKMWKLHSYLLEVTEMSERHTAENLTERMENIISNWSLDNKVSAVVHDNAANIVASMRDFSMDSVTCSAHNLQLSINKGLHDKSISEIVSKASAVVGHFNHSTKAVGELEKRQSQLHLPVHRLIKCVTTRWNSVFLMLERLLEQKTAIAAVLNDPSVTPAKKAVSLEINQHDWQVVEDLVAVLRPLQVATTALCSEKETTASSVLPIITKLKDKFLSVRTNDSEIIQNFKMKASQELDLKFNLTDDLWLSPLTMTSFLDPRYKSLGFLSDARRFDLLTLVRNRLNEQVSDETLTETKTATALDFLLSDELEDNTLVSVDTRMEELERYRLESSINRNDDPLVWWKNNQHRYPFLSKLARKYLCIPATSAPSERVFSSSGNIVTNRRSNLTPDIVKSLVFLHHNSKKQA